MLSRMGLVSFWAHVNIVHHIISCIRWGCTLASPGEYDWTVRVRLRCGLISYYVDHLVLPTSLTRGRTGLGYTDPSFSAGDRCRWRIFHAWRWRARRAPVPEWWPSPRRPVMACSSSRGSPVFPAQPTHTTSPPHVPLMTMHLFFIFVNDYHTLHTDNSAKRHWRLFFQATPNIIWRRCGVSVILEPWV